MAPPISVATREKMPEPCAEFLIYDEDAPARHSLRFAISQSVHPCLYKDQQEDQ
ncbi:hypothetical protein ISM_16810 [Roseovarius nubinhibens ISM]|uniref:Uncharacterized protein n=1 Tax=Roseovarius nubinhibens (strain ATCC BAA-591 / DSM 15170 / ISM) TaxID=89187 RepID=A3SQ06_ROSNI|nr:hypothetical protein ISM_16810 [Roseovarius nubinhibens ISM]